MGSALLLTLGLGAIAAGIVLGSRIPIALTSRADKPLARLTSCALVTILAHQKIRRGL